METSAYYGVVRILSLFLLLACTALLAAQPPSVVLIVADDMGWGDVSCFGGDIATPNIDSIARDGARLTSWYVTSPVCTPSRFSLMTGRYPQRSRGGLHRVGMMFNASHRAHGLREGETTIAEVLRGAGYRTALVGKWHLGHGDVAHAPTRHGFDHFYGALGGCVDYFTHRYATVDDWYRNEQPLDEPGYATDLITAEADRFLRDQRAEQPFLLVVSYTAPHYGKSCAESAEEHPATLVTSNFGTPRPGPEGEPCQPVNTLQAKPEDVAALATIENDARRHYAAMVRSLDDGIGRVLGALEATGRADETVVIFMADNGPDETKSSAGHSGPLRGAKHSLHEGGIRVPAAVRWPGRIAPGTRIDAPGSALDLLPTLARTAGAPADALTTDGVDLHAAWFAQQAPDRALFWRHGRTAAVRRGRWKLISGKLYDVVGDRGETTDVAPEHPDVVTALEGLLAAWERDLESARDTTPDTR